MEARLIKELEKNFRLSREELKDLQTRFKPKNAYGRVQELPMEPSVAFDNAISDNSEGSGGACRQT